MAEYPGAVKNFLQLEDGVDTVLAQHMNERGDEISAIETELGANPAGSLADLVTRLAVALNNDGTIKAVVGTGQLKTSTGEVSTTNYAQLTLAGGTYCFYPQIKMSDAATNQWEGHITSEYGTATFAGWTTYATNIALYGPSYTIYAQARYITASGENHWLFLLVDKNTREILASYSAPDHVSYGYGGNYRKIAHPFRNYNPQLHDIVLLTQKDTEDIKAHLKSYDYTEEFELHENLYKDRQGRFIYEDSKLYIPNTDLIKVANKGQIFKDTFNDESLLSVIDKDFKVNTDHKEIYKPLHTGKIYNMEKNIQIFQMVKEIPEYVTVRRMDILSSKERADRKAMKEQRRAEWESKQLERKVKYEALKSHLKITDEDVELLKKGG